MLPSQYSAEYCRSLKRSLEDSLRAEMAIYFKDLEFDLEEYFPNYIRYIKCLPYSKLMETKSYWDILFEDR